MDTQLLINGEFVAGTETPEPILDPRSGEPASRGLSTAAVIGPSARAADAWSTALLVLGAAAQRPPDLAFALLETPAAPASPAWRLDQGLPANREIASAKVYASEMLARVTDAALQIYGGMGLMSDYPIERFWRDARVERIWDGTSEIQRHIISRDIFRPLGA